MAAIIQRSGIYYIQFYDKAKKPTRKRHSLKTKRKDVARKLFVRFEKAYELREFDPWTQDPFKYNEPEPEREPTTLDAALAAFLAQKKRDGRTENTLISYEAYLGQFISRVGGETHASNVTAAHVDAYVKDTSVSRVSRHTRYRHVRAFIRWCCKQELIEADPTARMEAPEKPQKLPKSMSAEELGEICEGLRQHYAETNCREGEIVWQIPMYWFAYYMGLRPSELSRLRWKYIDAEKRLVYIFEQKNKREQTVPLNRKAAAILQDVQQGAPEDYVFRSPSFTGTQRSARRFREHVGRTFKKARERAGIDRKLTPHSLRHSFCTRIAEAGKSAVLIKEAARHADISTSMIYVHLSNEHLKAELDDVFD